MSVAARNGSVDDGDGSTATRSPTVGVAVAPYWPSTIVNVVDLLRLSGMPLVQSIPPVSFDVDVDGRTYAFTLLDTFPPSARFAAEIRSVRDEMATPMAVSTTLATATAAATAGTPAPPVLEPAPMIEIRTTCLAGSRPSDAVLDAYFLLLAYSYTYLAAMNFGELLCLLDMAARDTLPLDVAAWTHTAAALVRDAAQLWVLINSISAWSELAALAGAGTPQPRAPSSVPLALDAVYTASGEGRQQESAHDVLRPEELDAIADAIAAAAVSVLRAGSGQRDELKQVLYALLLAWPLDGVGAISYEAARVLLLRRFGTAYAADVGWLPLALTGTHFVLMADRVIATLGDAPWPASVAVTLADAVRDFSTAWPGIDAQLDMRIARFADDATAALQQQPQQPPS